MVGEPERGVHILPPPRRVALEPDRDLLLRFGGNGGHVCGVGGAPKEGQTCIRVCSCGQFYAYNGRRWSWLFDVSGAREWHVQRFPAWRRLLLQLQGWDAQRCLSNPSHAWIS